MRILVIGSGGREHALVWKLSHSPEVSKLYCVPGNDGMDSSVQRATVAVDDPESLLEFARAHRIDLTMVGPEAPLVAGVVDRFRQAGLAIVGPTAAAARLEGSKVFAKDFMQRHGIPTARYETHTAFADALASLEAGHFRFPVVVKADGLAAGKGVIIADDPAAARTALESIMEARAFGAAGDRVVIEEFLRGEEASFMVFADGEHILPMVPSQDHKAVFDGDRGPNTGGMGAYSDDRILETALREEIMSRIIVPTIRGMAAEGAPFTGVLYAGLMLTADGPQVLEFNVRFGDPETQVVLPRLKSDLVPILASIPAGTLDRVVAEWDPEPAVCVVLAAGGYPGSYEKGRSISGLDMAGQLSGVTVFHAGTRRVEERCVTAGGRVLGVTARAEGLEAAIMRAYEAVNSIYFEGMHYRRDIGEKGLRRYQ